MEEVSKQTPDSKGADAVVDKESLGQGTTVKDLIEYHDVDPVLAGKMTLLNQVCQDLSMSRYQPLT
jgi:hypothetical protein